MGFLRVPFYASTPMTPADLIERLRAITRPHFLHFDSRGGLIDQALDPSGACDLLQGIVTEELIRVRRRPVVEGVSTLLDAAVSRSGDRTEIRGTVRFTEWGLAVLAVWALFPGAVSWQLHIGGALDSAFVPLLASVLMPTVTLFGAHLAVVASAERFARQFEHLCAYGERATNNRA